MNNIRIQNIYYMLAYAFKALKQKHFDSVQTEQFSGADDLFAAVLQRGVAQQIKQGLTRRYVVNEQEISTLRGKLCLTPTLKLRLQHKQRLHCQFDTMSEDTLFNQILKTAMLHLCQHKSVSRERKQELRRLLPYFADVQVVSCPWKIQWRRLQFSRNDSTYEMLVGLCRLIFAELLLTTTHGDNKLHAFDANERMCYLYERFILEYYNKEHKQLKVEKAKIRWQLDNDEDHLLPGMISDIMLSDDRRVLIIDAKYYANSTIDSYNTRMLHPANIYQIFTYVKNRALYPDGKKVAGLLLYAQAGQTIDRTYSMSGNQISAKTLNLDCPFDDIRSQLDGIVDSYFAPN